ncbi:MAG TPA: ATP-binding cassette domain-containing protein [Gammaproteobacteria bacterium]
MNRSPAPLVDLDGVDVDIDGTPILRSVDFRLEPGRHWGVVGANGSGKSTFLALIAGLRWPAPGRGTRTYDFGRGPARDAIDARREITLVGHELQDRYTRLEWNFPAEDVVLSGVFRTDVPRMEPTPAQTARVRALLDELALSHLADRPFLELSRGEQRRVLIARSLAFRPRVLLLDEPASGLDASARAALDAMLARVAEHVQLVIAAHAAEDLPDVVTHVLVLEHGRIAASGPRERPAPAAAARAAGGPAPRPARVDAAAGRTAHGSGGATAGPAGAARAPSPGAPPLIDVRGADVWLGARRVLHGIDWQLRDGEHWLVKGPNGAGKSSFLRLLHGQHRPARGGTIRWPGLGDPASVWTLRRRVAWVSPELQAGYRYRATVRDAVGSGFDSSLGLVRRLRPDERERVEVLLGRFDLTALADRLLTELSYGQFRRVLLARALVHRPRVLLLDEPWEGLDRTTAALLAERLDECAAEGTQLVCASHLAIDGARYTHALALEEGVVVAAGPARSFGGRPVIPRADASA